LPYVADDLRVVYRGSLPRPKAKFGDWVRDPREIQAQVKQFTKECAADPELADKLLRARRYRHFVVDPATSRIAPQGYAMTYGATLDSLRAASYGDLDIPHEIQNARLEPIDDSRIRGISDRAWTRLKTISPDYPVVREQLTFHLIRQRCLVSADPKLPTKPLTLTSELYPNLKRIESADPALMLEEVERDRPAARHLIEAAKECGKMFGKKLKRNNHFSLIDPKKTMWWVFLPRRVTLTNLHFVLRSVLAESLEYRYRYGKHGIKLKPVVLLSTPISPDNSWVVSLLNSHDIFVCSYDKPSFVAEGMETTALSWLTG
jgi:hypothetical protein